jgi:hypothetical protein
MNSCLKTLGTTVVLVSLLLASGSLMAATYRLELKSGNTILQSKDFEYSKGTSSKLNHPHSGGTDLKGYAIEIGDDVSACGTFLQVKKKYEPKTGTTDVVGAMVTLVEKSTIQSGKMNAQTGDSDQIEKKNETVSVKSAGMNRTCTLVVVK